MKLTIALLWIFSLPCIAGQYAQTNVKGIRLNYPLLSSFKQQKISSKAVKFLNKINGKLSQYKKGSRRFNHVELLLLEKDLSTIHALAQLNKISKKIVSENCPLKDKSTKAYFDDEADAIRHFFAMIYFSYLKGPNWAYLFMTAHEATDHIIKSNQMDLYNNWMASQIARTKIPQNWLKPAPVGLPFYWARKASRKRKVIQMAVTEAFKHLDQGQLIVLKTTNTKCARKQLYPNF